MHFADAPSEGFTEGENAVVDEDGDIVAAMGITVGELLEQAGESASFTDADGNALSSEDKIGTGVIVTLSDGTQYAIVVLGDIDGEGSSSSIDARNTLRNAVGLDDLNNAQLKAADVNGDGIVNSADARDILRASVGLEDPAEWFNKLVR